MKYERKIVTEISDCKFSLQTNYDLNENDIKKWNHFVLEFSSGLKSKKSNITEFIPVPKKEEQQEVVRPAERELIRPRLPNDADIKYARGNKIDLSELNIKYAKKYTLNAGKMRCPSCGQTHSVIITVNDPRLSLTKDNCFLMFYAEGKDRYECIASSDDLESTNWFLSQYKDSTYYKETHHNVNKDYIPFVEYHNDLQSKDIVKSLDIVADEENKNKYRLICPVCNSENLYDDWVNALDEPNQEYDFICDVCGGEMVPVVNKDNNDDMLKCECCGSIRKRGK